MHWRKVHQPRNSAIYSPAPKQKGPGIWTPGPPVWSRPVFKYRQNPSRKISSCRSSPPVLFQPAKSPIVLGRDSRESCSPQPSVSSRALVDSVPVRSNDADFFAAYTGKLYRHAHEPIFFFLIVGGESVLVHHHNRRVLGPACPRKVREHLFDSSDQVGFLFCKFRGVPARHYEHLNARKIFRCREKHKQPSIPPLAEQVSRCRVGEED